MLDDWVGELRLRVRTDVADDVPRTRAAAERFARAVIERCAELLEARAPGRLVRVRTLPVHWRLLTHGLDSDQEVARFAAILADALEARVPAVVEEPSSDDEIAVFESEAHFVASRLRARARGTAAWFHVAAGADEEPLATLAAPGRHDLAMTTLARLAGTGDLVDALVASPPAAVQRLADALATGDDGDGETPAGSVAGDVQPSAPGPAVNAVRARLVTLAASSVAPTPALAALALH